jgi:hypothetical protein
VGTGSSLERRLAAVLSGDVVAHDRRTADSEDWTVRGDGWKEARE